jgi:FMN-dependent oxidoreductase (nitrilotriacetate monooxygenase family)
MTDSPKIALALLAHASGSHAAAWLHPSTVLHGSNDVDHYRALAQTAERGRFDLFFIADTPAARTEKLDAYARFPMFMNVFEPVTILAALAGSTTHIGLGGTVSTSFTEPYNVARQFASLDHISHGRAGWNVVTSANDFAARNFGHAKLAPHAERYERAREFVHVVQALWDTWEDDAFIRDRERGLFFDPGKQHPVSHEGKFFRVDGALNIARTPQGQPVIIQAGASETGKELAAETAEVVFASETEVDRAAAFYRDLKGRMAKYNRAPDQLKILSGMPVVVADSDDEAEELYQHLQSLIQPEVGLLRLGMDLETDLSDLPLDEPVPEDRIPKTSNLHKMYFDRIAEMIRKDRLTLRQLYMRYERGNKTLRGSVKTVADHMENWFRSGGSDGFMLTFPILPLCLDRFVGKVVPELQRRGLFRADYAGATLRENLGLIRPVNRHVRGTKLAAE